ncbi:MAG TPA: helix-turn-helix domain-containing protein [Thermoanaerobaculia bacterium]|nr:helix-turn-helix domain-containing protein [Thermoanaerobaculia bacterium]
MSQPRALDLINAPEQASSLLDPTRRQMLLHLLEPDSAAGLARKLGQPRQRLGYHLRELEKAGLVETVGERRKRGCVERLMRATARAFVISPDILGPLGLPPEVAGDRASTAYALGSAARVLTELGALDTQARGLGKRLATLTLDSEIRFASAEARAAFAEELAAGLAALVARYHDETAEGGRRFRLTTLVHPIPSSLPKPTAPES